MRRSGQEMCNGDVMSRRCEERYGTLGAWRCRERNIWVELLFLALSYYVFLRKLILQKFYKND